MKPIINILIVDDHTVYREGLKFVLSQIEGFKIDDEAKTGIEFLEKIELNKPDIVLMDISMPEMDGIEATERALKKYNDLKIVTLSSYGDEVYYYKMVKAGASGFIQKQADKEEIEKAIIKVYNGETYFPAKILQNIIIKMSNSEEDSISIDLVNLTKREKEILGLICNGYSNKEISEKLFLSPKTIENHRTNIISKTGTKNTAHLVMYSIKNKLIEL